MTGDLRICLTQRDLAARWRVSGRTLERWRAQRYGPAWITIGGSIRYRMSDVLAWETAHLTQP
ncbi:helix-turn-helix transcriptional regulator [Roseovarius sp. Pro17]|uniref:helix-turn-helix transcriptional regulator n=1 Tax=Roseovarius sp. Pro17 TaxID=3108175 RepID=UPI002D797DBC|nr:helix-turn-helix domain-containing protein [Roseovarius sp. Pro17]